MTKQFKQTGETGAAILDMGNGAEEDYIILIYDSDLLLCFWRPELTYLACM